MDGCLKWFFLRSVGGERVLFWGDRATIDACIRLLSGNLVTGTWSRYIFLLDNSWSFHCPALVVVSTLSCTTVKTGMNVGKFGINVEKNGTKKVHF